ncbi:Hypothetical predicted protein, partial [Marmota monax]
GLADGHLNQVTQVSGTLQKWTFLGKTGEETRDIRYGVSAIEEEPGRNRKKISREAKPRGLLQNDHDSQMQRMTLSGKQDFKETMLTALRTNDKSGGRQEGRLAGMCPFTQ